MTYWQAVCCVFFLGTLIRGCRGPLCNCKLTWNDLCVQFAAVFSVAMVSGYGLQAIVALIERMIG